MGLVIMIIKIGDSPLRPILANRNSHFLDYGVWNHGVLSGNLDYQRFCMSLT